jgi:Ser/Thr protein kinase RdoA (MazF antagonist)
MEIRLSELEKDLIQKEFKINIKEVIPVCKSINETFRLNCYETTLALRKSLTNPYYNLENTNFEYDVLLTLNKNNSRIIKPFSQPIKRDNAIYFLTYWISGKTLSPQENLHKEIGKNLSELHIAMKKIRKQPPKAFSSKYIEDLIKDSDDPYLNFRRYLPYSSDIETTNRLMQLEEMLIILKRDSKNWSSHLDKEQLVHGDPRSENFILSFNGINCIDFQSMRKDYPVSDIGWCLTSGLCKFGEDELDLTMAEEFLKGYFKRPNSVNLSPLIPIIKIRHLRSLDTIYYFKLIEKLEKPELYQTEKQSLNIFSELDKKNKELKKLIKVYK